MSRFFVSPSDVEGRYVYITDKNDLHHMKKVLRLSAGDEVDISDGSEWEYKTEIEELGEKEARLRILDKQKFAREPKTRITLYQGVPKGSKMEEIIQKSVELGVNSVVPVFMDRTIVVDKGNFGKKLLRWQKIADEAVKQCRRGIIPQVEEPAAFAEILEKLADYDIVVFPYENEDRRTIKDHLKESKARLGKHAEEGKDASRCSVSNEEKGALRCSAPEEKQDGTFSAAIIVGPEGGFSEKEAELLKENGICGVSLGKTILRTETAGPAAIAMTMYELEL